MQRDIADFNPAAVVVDPISAFRGVQSEIHSTLLRLADVCKERGITAFFTSLSLASDHASEADRGVSSLMDTWISLTDLESSGERNRVIFVLKARGMSHSNQMREYLLTGSGIRLIDPYVGPEGVLTGAARQAQEARERNESLARSQAIERRKRDLDRRRASVERQIAELRASLEAEESEAAMLGRQEAGREETLSAERLAMAILRGGGRMSLESDITPDPAKPGHYNLRLYVAGHTPKSVAAIANLKSICDEHLAGMYTIEVIDLLLKPQLAAGDQILAVPTLVRRLPPPIKRIIGNLADTERVLVGLDIKSGEPPAP